MLCLMKGSSFKPRVVGEIYCAVTEPLESNLLALMITIK